MLQKDKDRAERTTVKSAGGVAERGSGTEREPSISPGKRRSRKPGDVTVPSIEHCERYVQLVDALHAAGEPTSLSDAARRAGVADSYAGRLLRILEQHYVTSLIMPASIIGL